MIGQALREAREQYQLTQDQVAAIGYISPKTVSAIECGRRSMAPELLALLTQTLDNPWLAMQAAAEVTGGAYCSPRLDGEDVDLHRTSVWVKTLEELREAQDSLAAISLVNKPRPEDERRAQVREALLQALDARVAIDHLVAVVCQEYQVSISGLYSDHRNKLEQRGYLKTKKKAAQRAAR